ncbi:MAG: dihydroneopterin aldolase [Crocinitomicaceae bacterium]
MHLVEVIGIECYAYHGCMVEESVLGGKYIVDVSIETDFTKAAQNDELGDTIDYVTIKEIVTTEMAVRSKLIEHVGQRITNQFKLQFPGLIESTIKIRKVNPPIKGTVKEVAIVIKSKR